MPRATTAAWLVAPPRAVRIPRLSLIPLTSTAEFTERMTMIGSLLRLIGAESGVPSDGSWGRGQPARDGMVAGARIDRGKQELLETAGIYPQNGFVFLDQAFCDHLHGDAHLRAGGALAIASL